MFTKCNVIINQQAEFLRKNNKMKLTFFPCCKERLFQTKLNPGTSMGVQCEQSKKSHPHICHVFEPNDCGLFPEGFEYPHHLKNCL